MISPYLVRPPVSDFAVIAGDFSHLVMCYKFNKGWDCHIYTEHGYIFLFELWYHSLRWRTAVHWFKFKSIPFELRVSITFDYFGVYFLMFAPLTTKTLQYVMPWIFWGNYCSWASVWSIVDSFYDNKRPHIWEWPN